MGTVRSAAARRQSAPPSGAEDEPLPRDYRPQLATLVKSPPEGDEWVHEIKFDGYRIGCRIDRGKVRLFSRRGKDWTSSFPTIAAAARRLPVHRAFLDGEVAALLPDGRTSFQALQNSFGRGDHSELAYFAFDLLHLDGRDLGREPLSSRKAELEHLLRSPGDAGTLRYSQHFPGAGATILAESCRLGLEGIVSKRGDLPYRPGRSTEWVKTKCVLRQEFVIGGFTDPEGSRQGIGALLAGVHDEHGRLVFAGKIGTGFTRASATELRRRLERLERKDCPFAERPPGWLGRNAHWVKPALVAEAAFTEWTGDGKIRHPSFQGIRDDKRPEDVTRERPMEPPTAPKRARVERATATTRKTPAAAEVAGVRLSHPDRVLFPEIGLSKLGLARYYESIAEWIVPHLRGRPLTLVRCPEGLADACFYMKHSKLWAPQWLRRVHIREKRKTGDYLIADTIEALIGLVQMDILEIHTWNSTDDRLEEPNRIVLDLDPGPDVPWREVVEAARRTRRLLDDAGLSSFVKTTGGAGLHVVVPLEPSASWQDAYAFSRAVAEALVAEDPKRYTTAIPKAGRERKILVDYLRNNRTNTSVAAFSTRARPRAPVSTPLDWDELSPRLKSDHYNVENVVRRLQSLRTDPWASYAKTKQRIRSATPNFESRRRRRRATSSTGR